MIHPFQIDDMEFEHAELDSSLYVECSELFNKRIRIATHRWRREQWVECDSGRTEMLAIKQSGGLVGVWVLYQMVPIDQDTNIVSCKAGPMLPEIGEVQLPGQEFDPEIDAQTRKYFSTSCRIMGWMMDNPMPQDDGTSLTIDHFVFPMAEAGDPAQHEWTGVKDLFELYCDRQCAWDVAVGGGDRIVVMDKLLKAGSP